MKKAPLPWWFEEVAAEAVRPSALQAVPQLLAFIRYDLHLRSIPVRWFRLRKGEMTPQERKDWNARRKVDRPYAWLNVYANSRLCGVAYKPTRMIWLRATMRTGKIIRVAAHEARHVWQFRKWSLKRDRVEAWEAEDDAEWYSEQVCRRLGLSPVTPKTMEWDRCDEDYADVLRVIAAHNSRVLAQRRQNANARRQGEQGRHGPRPW